VLTVREELLVFTLRVLTPDEWLLELVLTLRVVVAVERPDVPAERVDAPVERVVVAVVERVLTPEERPAVLAERVEVPAERVAAPLERVAAVVRLPKVRLKDEPRSISLRRVLTPDDEPLCMSRALVKPL